jgi:hypothetical protein
VEVRDQVREPRRCLAQGHRAHVEVPPAGQHRHGHRAGADRADRVERVRIRRVVDHHAVAGAGEHAQQQGERVLRPRGHEHLVRRCRHTAAGEVLGDHRTQPPQPERVVARPGQVARQLGGRRRQRPVQRAFRRRAGSGAEVDDVLAGRRLGARRRRARVRRQACPAARAAAAGEESLVAERRVRGARRGAADAERGGQLALTGEPRAERQPAVEHEQAERAGERDIARA